MEHKKNWSFSRSKAITFAASEVIDNFGIWIGVMLESSFLFGLSIIPMYYFLFKNAPREQININSIQAIISYIWEESLWKINFPGFLISALIAGIIISWLWMGMKRIALDIYNQKETGIDRLFIEPALAVNYCIASILFTVIVAIGTLCFIVPGIIAFVTFRFYGPAIVEHKYGPIEALLYSLKITSKKTMEVLLFVFLTVLITKVFGIFSFLGLPFILLTDIYLYKKLEEEYNKQ